MVCAYIPATREVEAKEVKAVVSQTCTTVLQPRWKSETLSHEVGSSIVIIHVREERAVQYKYKSTVGSPRGLGIGVGTTSEQGEKINQSGSSKLKLSIKSQEEWKGLAHRKAAAILNWVKIASALGGGSNRRYVKTGQIDPIGKLLKIVRVRVSIWDENHKYGGKN